MSSKQTVFFDLCWEMHTPPLSATIDLGDGYFPINECILQSYAFPDILHNEKMKFVEIYDADNFNLNIRLNKNATVSEFFYTLHNRFKTKTSNCFLKRWFLDNDYQYKIIWM